MNRREALKRLAVLAGGALSASTVAGVMGGCTAKSGSFSPQTLSNDQNELVIQLTERIIPATDTPGAAAAKVNQFIDLMLTDWNTEAEKEHFLEGLDNVDKVSNREFSHNFVDLDTEQKISIMEKLQEDAIANPNPVPESDLDPFFDMLKEFTVVGYYTSEIGATQELNEDIVPGYYDACMPLSDVGRAWS